MSRSRSISVILQNGNPNGVKIAELETDRIDYILFRRSN
jgi:hypothetical protein